MKKDKTYLICPCCKKAKHNTEVRTMSKLLKKLSNPKKEHGYIPIISNFHSNNIEDDGWACDECLDRVWTEPADPYAQLFLDHPPYFFYYDSKRKCEKCEAEYIFSISEKRFWYEELKFWVQSKPKHCIPCRKEVRQQKQDNKRLSELLEGFDKLTIIELEEIIQIYSRMNKEEKVKYYHAVLKKKKPRRSDSNQDH